MLSRTVLVAATIAIAIRLPTMAGAQRNPILVEAEGLVGYSAVNLEKWAKGSPYDWDQGASGASARLLVPVGRAYMGIEYGFQYLFWYEHRYEWGYSESDVESQHFSAITRFSPAPRVDVDAGIGLHLFSDFTDPGLYLGASYRLIESARFSIPVGIRVDPVFDSDALVVPISLKLGLSLKVPRQASEQRSGRAELARSHLAQRRPPAAHIP